MLELKVKSSNTNNFLVPVINLSSNVLTEKEQNHLKHGLKYWSTDHNTNVKKYLSVELETIDELEDQKLAIIQLKRLHLSWLKIANQKQIYKSSTRI